MSDYESPAPQIAEPTLYPVPPSPIAPIWHTVVLVVGILALSFGGRTQLSHLHGGPSRLVIYGSTAFMELVMLGWVALGLRLRKVRFRSLLGDVSRGLRGLALDLGVALVFWIAALTILGTLGILWAGAQYAIEHRHAPAGEKRTIEPSAAQKQTVQELAQLAPASPTEVACWIALCIIAGFIEETVFRGYLQQQFAALSHGRIAVGVVVSALLFGAAHGYQGARNMILLAVFGVLFSLLAIFRRSLRAGIFAHGWHDMIAGLALAALRSHHLV